MMRVALLSDVHGNSIALDAVLQDIQSQGGVNAYWVLGDLAAIGHDPIGVLERLAELPESRLIRGNTDRYLVTGERPPPTVEQCRAHPGLWPARVEVASTFSWTQGAVMVAGWVEWLGNLPLESRLVLPDGTCMLGVHAAPGCDDGQGVRPGLRRQALRSLVAGGDADLVFVGHTHWPMEIQLDEVHVINVGSVSNAFPPDLRASYVLLEADEAGYRLWQRRVAYDYEAVVEALWRVNHPTAAYIARHMRGEIDPPWTTVQRGCSV